MKGYNFFYLDISNIYLCYWYNEPTNAQLINNLVYCSLLHRFSMTDHLEFKEQKTQTLKARNTPTQTQRKKLITFTCRSPLIHKVANLSKLTDLNIAFRTCDTMYSQLRDMSTQKKQTLLDCLYIYRLIRNDVGVLTTCQFRTNSIILLMFVESQKVHI